MIFPPAASASHSGKPLKFSKSEAGPGVSTRGLLRAFAILGVWAIFVEFSHGGARANSGGARPGAGRPRKAPQPVAPLPNVERWHVVRATFGQTRIADTELRLAGFEVFSPTIFVPARKPYRDSNGVMHTARPERVDFLFDRYIMTRFNAADPDWYRISALAGVDHVLASSRSIERPYGVPLGVSDIEIERIRDLVGPSGCLNIRNLRFAKGARLRLIAGPMIDQIGVCENSDGVRVRLQMSMFGRAVPVDTTHDEVEPVS